MFLRLPFYLIIFSTYLIFMSSFSPLGIAWLEWHGNRIFNAVEFLKINGYFSSYFFTIWSKCDGCDLSFDNWSDKIYLSRHYFNLFPYIVLNHFGDYNFLIFFGSLFDKFIIFLTAVFSAEIFIIILKKKYDYNISFIAICFFTIFTVSPWTYKMILAPWAEIYVLFFFLISIFFFMRGFKFYGLIFMFVIGLFQYQWSVILSIYYIILLFIPFILSKNINYLLFVPKIFTNSKDLFLLILFLLIPVIFYLFLRFYFQSNFATSSGSSLLFRIGISGIDEHNGGLIGALQFLGGNRITHCILSSDLNLDLEYIKSNSISVYNCLLSIISMFIISLLGLFGSLFLIIKINEFKFIIMPLLFAIFTFIAIFQQSLSVHLMGYSYIFSFIFSSGIIFIFSIFSYNKHDALRLILGTPLVIAIILLSVRVSMLTGING
jgi:hypothetical protein